MKILVGAGGMAKDFITYLGRQHINLVDDYKKGSILGYPIVSTVSEFLNDRHLYIRPEVYNCIGSIGDNTTRNEVYQKLYEAGVRPKNIIMSAFISKDVVLGSNILANVGSQIHHDCVINSNVVISPGAIICGDVHVCKNAFIGAGATIIQGVTVFKNSIIGAGAVVTKDVPSNEVWGGVPARRLKGCV